MGDATKAARVSVTARSLWRMRLSAAVPRYLLCFAASLGLLASARFAIDPPHAVSRPVTVRTTLPPDRAAEAFATLFARRYLTWNAAEPQASERGLEAFAGAGIEPGLGLQLPASGEQRVQWAEVAQSRQEAPNELVYTVAAQTDTAGLLYLTVPVTRTAGGGLALGGYPAFVGPPASTSARVVAGLREVREPGLATVVQRALRNYMANAYGELAADLTSNARVTLPDLALTIESMPHLDWAQEGSAVLATVQAEDARGVQYTLAYELDVTREQGRWEISAVQMDPDAQQ